jgi:hypothetical protein
MCDGIDHRVRVGTGKVSSAEPFDAVQESVELLNTLRMKEMGRDISGAGGGEKTPLRRSSACIPATQQTVDVCELIFQFAPWMLHVDARTAIGVRRPRMRWGWASGAYFHRCLYARTGAVLVLRFLFNV